MSTYFNSLDQLIHTAINSDDIERLAEAIGFDNDMLYQRVESLLGSIKPRLSDYAVKFPVYSGINHSRKWGIKSDTAQDIPNKLHEIEPMQRIASLTRQKSHAANVNGGHTEKPVTVAPYRTVVRKYLRTVKAAYGGEIKKTAYVNVVISDTENAEPDDFSANLYPVFTDEKREQANHVRAQSKYARRELRKTTQETFNARQSEQVAQWLASASEEKRESVLSLLESPLNPVDPHYVSNIPDPIWQKELDSIETKARAGGCPTLRVSDWDKFHATVQYTLALSDNGHWCRIGNAKHGDASIVLKANRFAEYRRQYLLNHRWVTPGKAEAFETLTGIEREDTQYLLRILGMGIRSDATSVKRPGSKNPSDRVRAARERARAKRAARLASK